VLIGTVSSITSKIDNLEKKLAAVEAVTERVEALEKEASDIRTIVNNVDQDAHACIVRISGLMVSDADMTQHGFEKAIIKKAYDRIIKPILTVAKNNGILESVPTMLNVVEQGFIASRGGKDKLGKPLPPPSWAFASPTVSCATPS
jgi:hypothetical protein